MTKKIESKVLDLAEEQLEKRIEKIKKDIEYYKTLRTRFTIAQSFYMISSIAAKLMFIVFTKPNQFTKTYTEAAQIADDWFNKTGEVVAVEQSQHHPTKINLTEVKW